MSLVVILIPLQIIIQTLQVVITIQRPVIALMSAVVMLTVHLEWVLMFLVVQIILLLGIIL